MQPTPEQHDAIHIHKQNLIVVAGAGSGKTRVLVERYLTLLEANPDWNLNSLVAITFTREAAFEMRNRVRKSLEDNVRDEDDETKASRWATLLSEMDTARIDTIHGLCVTILRANAAQAGIDPKFEVLDEIEASIILEDIVRDVISTIAPPLSELFSVYESSKVIDALLSPKLINAEMNKHLPDKDSLMETWEAQRLQLMVQAKEMLLNSDAVYTVRNQIPVDPAELNDTLGQKHLWFCQQLDALESIHDPQAIFDFLIQMRADGGNAGKLGSEKVWGTKEARQVQRDILKAINAKIDDLKKYVGVPLNEVDEATAYFLSMWYELILQVQTAYRDHKRDNSLLDFDDLERITADLLEDESVRQRYQNNEFKHLLVDEFQDTNQAQWRIIKSLASLEHGGSMFVVGDPKQSIYQFRGADVGVFEDVRDEIASHIKGKALPLSVSFRTHHRLVEQFNALFARILVRDDSSPVSKYQVTLDKTMSAHREESPEQPVIECLLLDNGVRDEQGDYVKKPNSNSKQTYPPEDMRRWEAYEIANFIEDIVAQERLVYDKEQRITRPVTTGDVAILFQSMSNVTLYEDVFKSRGLQFMTIAGRGYYSRQEVWDMLDLLRALHNPADNLSLASVLRSPMFGFSDDMLFALRLITDNHPEKPKPILLWDALKVAREQEVMGIRDSDMPLIQIAVDNLHDLRLMAGRVTISELLRQALAKTGYLAMLTGLPDGARRRGNIEKLLQLAETSGKITLGKFSQYLSDLTAREIREGEAIIGADETIKMMTVHASKGLEFPVVILADTSWSRGNAGGDDTVMNDDTYGLSCQVFDPRENKYVSGFAHRRNNNLLKLKENAERKRLLYVAATRAQDFLVISGQVYWNKDRGWSTRGDWLNQLLDALDLRTVDFLPDQTAPFADDTIRVMMPPAPPAQDVLYADALEAVNLWDFDADEIDFPPMESPLIHAIQIAPAEQIGHISATQIADLGGVHYGSNEEQRQFYRQRFRRRTLHDVPSRVQDLGADRHPNISPRLIGEIVHEVIRYWKFDLPQDEFNEMLAGYAWQSGLTFQHDVEEAVQRTNNLLRRFQQSVVFDWVESARDEQRPLFNELPFILRTEKRVIHGIIDVLFQQADSTWVIVDYKTSKVTDQDFDHHARRYHLQLGVYASAVQEQLGGHIIPTTHIHYIRHSRTVLVPTDAWQTEIDKLEDYIGELVTADD